MSRPTIDHEVLISVWAQRTLQWVIGQELPTGGLAAWPGHEAYPEVTGYMIPTLMQYNLFPMVLRLFEWLESVQNSDEENGGSFNGLGNVGPQSFDTGAVLEGLRAISTYMYTPPIIERAVIAAGKARSWLEKQILPDGHLRVQPGNDRTEIYNVRVAPIMGFGPLTNNIDLTRAGRNHYLLYALEGLLNSGEGDLVRGELEKIRLNPETGLLDNRVGGGGPADVCATIQAACLRVRLGMPADHFIHAARSIQNEDGSFPHDLTDQRKVLWPCKYFLDLEFYIGSET